MKNIMLFFIIMATVILSVSFAYACEFNADCELGSHCIKSAGNSDGVCEGGQNQGNSNEQQSVYSPTDPSGTPGGTCSLDSDCGPGSACYKNSDYAYGTCRHN